MAWAWRPSLWVTLGALLCVAARVIYPCAVAAREYPSAPPLARFALTHQDWELLPQVRAASVGNFGEISLPERAGAGVRSFSPLSLAPHALGLRLGGMWGLLLVNLAVACAAFGVLRAFCRACAAGPALASALACLVIIGLPDLLNELLRPVLGESRQLFWGYGWRIPRPFVSEPVFLLAVLTLLRILRESALRRREWILFGLSVAFLIHVDIYAAIVLCLTLPGFFLLLLRYRRAAPRELLIPLLWAGGCIALGAAGFQAIRLFEHPDLTARMGVIPVPRLSPLFIWKFMRPALILLALGAGAAATCLEGKRETAEEEKRERREGRVRLLFFALLSLVAYFALPLSTLALGKTAQQYHFWERFGMVSCLAVLAGLLLAAERVRRRFLPCAGTAGSAGRPGAAAAMLLCLLLTTATLARQQPYVMARKHIPPFLGLLQAMEDADGTRAAGGADEREGGSILATFDSFLANYWLTSGAGRLYLPHTVNTVQPDEVLEGRFLGLCRLLGAEEGRMLRLAEENLYPFFGHLKYMAAKAHCFAPREEYTAAERAAIEASDVYRVHQLMLPRGEKERLAAQYASLRAPPRESPAWVALPRLKLLEGLAPPEEDYEFVYENESYRAWRRR